jgi:hypothetical protein
MQDGVDRNRHEDVVKNVELLLESNIELTATALGSGKEYLRSIVEHCEDRINEIFYQLYGLTPDENRVVKDLK